MNVVLLGFVLVYLLGTLALGAWVSRRVKNTSDFAVAGRSLPLAMVITTSFATWFGAETVMGIPARFATSNLGEIVEDPFGASMCLVFVGLFFAARLYRLNLLTIGDYYRLRYSRLVEVLTSIMIILSYLGWVAAQITALGLVFEILTGGQLDNFWGMIIGTVLVLIYVMMGGMLAVAYTDFIQMIVLVVGLIYIAFAAANLAGGASAVIDVAQQRELFEFFPESTVSAWLFFIGSAVTMMLGSIPQQDVFQRVMSAKDESTARNGAAIGGILYLLFAFIPMFVVVASFLIIPEQANVFLGEDGDSQYLLPTLILSKMPFIAQIFFFGALISAIKSTSSATLLAPATSFVENILLNLKPDMSDRFKLAAMRWSILVFACGVLTYAIFLEGSSIYEMVSSAYQITLVGSFVPLVFGLYWRRASNVGAVVSIILGLGVWIGSRWTPLIEFMPVQLAGLLAAIIGMVIGSLAVPPAVGEDQTQMALPPADSDRHARHADAST